jgi:hypothetical protein
MQELYHYMLNAYQDTQTFYKKVSDHHHQWLYSPCEDLNRLTPEVL